MLDRFRRRNDDDATSVLTDGDAPYEDRVAADREVGDGRTRRFERAGAAGSTGAATIEAEREQPLPGEIGPAGAEAARVVRARQRERFGGFNFGASFFGW